MKGVYKIKQLQRNSPQISCTVSESDLEFIKRVLVKLSNKVMDRVTISDVIRLLCKHGKMNEDELLKLYE